MKVKALPRLGFAHHSELMADFDAMAPDGLDLDSE
jgi:hypothetical protein